MAAFVVLLVAVWGVGFLWFRGDLKPSSDKPSDKTSQAKAEAKPSASAEPKSPSAVPSSTGKYTGQVSAKDERKAVDVNPAAARPKPIVLPPVVSFTMATFNLLGSSHSKPGADS